MRQRHASKWHSYQCFNPRTREGCDTPHFITYRIWRVSIHAPLARCDSYHHYFRQNTSEFQSTHLLRGATTGCPLRCGLSGSFNPRTSCEVRQQKDIFTVSFACIDGDIFPRIQFVITKFRDLIKIFLAYSKVLAANTMFTIASHRVIPTFTLVPLYNFQNIMYSTSY